MRGEFLKPIYSKMREIDGDKTFYYVAKVGNYARLLRKYGLGHLSFGTMNYSPAYSSPYFTKEEIDKFPRYMRRGGEYGHDAVRVWDKKLGSKEKHLCKLHGIEVIGKVPFNKHVEYYPTRST